MSRMLRGVASLTLMLSTPALAQQDAVIVGSLGDWRRVEWRGVEAFAPRAIESELRLLPGADDLAHPQAPRAPFLLWLRERVLRGYEYAGFGQTEVTTAVAADGHLVVTVSEGPRVRAGELRVIGDGVAVEEVRVELADDSGSGSLRWQEGGPGCLGRYAAAALEQRLQQSLLERGMITARVDLAIRIDAKDVAGLDITVHDARPVTVSSFELVDDPDVDVEDVARRIGFQPGSTLNPQFADTLRRQLLGLTRYRDVQVEFAGQLSGGTVESLRVRTRLIEDAPALTAVPWRRLDLLQRSFAAMQDSLGDRLAMQIVTSGHATGGHCLWLGDGSLVYALSPTLGEGSLPIPPLFARLGRDQLTIRIGGSGFTWKVEASWLEHLHAGISWSPPDGEPTGNHRNSLTWLVAYTSAATPPAEFRGSDRLIHAGPCAVWWSIHPVALRRWLEDRAWQEPEDGVLTCADDRMTARLAPDRGEFQFEFDSPPDDRTGFRASLRVDSRDALPAPRSPPASTDAAALEVELVQLATRVLGERTATARSVARLAIAAAGSLREGGGAANDAGKTSGFFVPRDPQQLSPSGLQALATAFSRDFGERFPFRSWPAVVCRELPCFLSRVSPERWRGAVNELIGLRDDPATGPIGCMLISGLARQDGVAPVRTMFARAGLERCDAAAFANDCLTLAEGLPETPAVLGAIAASWRDLADAGALADDLATHLRNAADDRAACRVGLEYVWDAGLGDLIEALLRENAAD